MSTMRHVNLRLSDEQLAVIEKYRQKLEKGTGLRVSRSDAIRALIASSFHYQRIAEGNDY